MTELQELKLAYAECSRQRNELLNKLKSQTQRTWQGLTDEKTEHLWEISRAAMPRYHTFKTLIEKALRERNT